MTDANHAAFGVCIMLLKRCAAHFQQRVILTQNPFKNLKILRS